MGGGMFVKLKGSDERIPLGSMGEGINSVSPEGRSSDSRSVPEPSAGARTAQDPVAERAKRSRA